MPTLGGVAGLLAPLLGQLVPELAGTVEGDALALWLAEAGLRAKRGP